MEAYRYICARLGKQPSPEICADLHEQGALVVDLELCRDLEAVFVFLREAPPGVRQLVLYNGSLFFGRDRAYQEKVQTAKLRSGSPLLWRCAGYDTEARIWQLINALVAFCTSPRGSGITVLELTGVPFGSQGRLRAAPLAACLTPLHALQRLHLAGCCLRDRGLAALLPCLVSRLPKLSHLSLARNGLRDARLLAHFLRGRAAAQSKRQAVALAILDLSQNPNLTTQRKAFRPFARANSSPNLNQPKVSHEGLMQIICDALKGGLMLATLRLRSMRIVRDDLRPLLRLLYQETAHQQAPAAAPKSGGAAPARPPRRFPLVEVSLENNPLEPEFPAAIAHVLRELGRRPSSLDQPRNVELRRCNSTPSCCDVERVVPKRNCVSDGDADTEPEGTSDGEDEPPGARLSELDRAKLRFQAEAAVLTRRLDDWAAGAARHRFGVGGRSHAPPTAFEQPPSSEGSDASGPTFGVIPVHNIPDRSAEFGFAPAWAPDMGGDIHSSTTSSMSSRSSRGSGRRRAARRPSAGAAAQQPLRAGGGGAAAAGRGDGHPAQRHTRLELLHGVLQQSNAASGDPEVLRYALDFMASASSIDMAETEALMSQHLQELQQIGGAHAAESSRLLEFDQMQGSLRSRPAV